LAKELEERARTGIDRLLESIRLLVQSVKGTHTHAARDEVLLREFALNVGFDSAD